MSTNYQKSNLLALIAIMLLCTTDIWSQKNCCLEQISTNQGLPGINIRKLYQDEIGYIWFGIEAVGLCKYDGAAYTVFENNPQDSLSLSNNFIWDIVESKRNLWIATENGLNLYHRDKGIFSQFYKESCGLSSNGVISLFLDHNGNLWVGTNRGLDIINSTEISRLENTLPNANNKFYIKPKIRSLLCQDSIEHINGNLKIYSFYQDKDQKIWVSSNNGVFIFSPNQRLLKHLNYNNGNSGLVFPIVKFIGEWNENNLLIGTDRGMCIYNQKNNTFSNKIIPELNDVKFKNKGYSCFQKDERGKYWIGMSEGIIVIDPTESPGKRLTYISEGDMGLSSKTVCDILLDKSGQIWISTKFEGLFIYNQYLKLFTSNTIDIGEKSSFPYKNSFILSAYAGKDEVWLGTKDKGLVRFDLKSKQYYTYSMKPDYIYHKTSNRIECIGEDEESNIWFGNLKGLNKLNKKTGEIETFPFYVVRTLLFDSKGKLWIGTTHGVYSFDKSTKKFELNKIRIENSTLFVDSSLFVNTIYEDSKQNIWFGTATNGVYLYHRKENKIDHFCHKPQNPQSISNNSIRAICEDIKGRIWIGTKHGGVNYFDPVNKTFKSITKADGLPSNAIYSIQSTFNGDLWLGTHNGLSRLSLSEWKIRNFDISHGLQSNIFEKNSYTKTFDGHLLFGGEGGFNYFHPDSFAFNVRKFPLVLNSVKVNRDEILTDIPFDTNIQLKYFQNYIDIEFSLLNYKDPSRNSFRYMLEGIDNHWIDAGTRRYVSYTDLKSGKYTFRLEALGADNELIANPIILNINVSPPWWFSNLAYIIYFIVLIVLFYAIFKIATMRANFRNKLNESRKAVQISMETNEAKLRFFTNISHEFLSPLALISMPVEKLNNSKNLSETEKQYVKLIRKNTNRLNRLIKQLMYFRRTQNDFVQLKVMQGNIVDFIEKVTHPFSLFAQQLNIDFNVRCADEAIDMWFDPDKVEKIVSNLLMNAFKFTPSKGSVEIWITTSTKNVISDKTNFLSKKSQIRQIVNISVRDSGKGMTEEEQKNIFKRFYSGNNENLEGSGIGLELVKTLVELHGGSISVKSKPGKGSSFTFSLFQDHNYMKDAQISQEEIIPDNYISNFDYSEILSSYITDERDEIAKQNTTQKPSILIVEDNNDLRKFIHENLIEEYNVITAKNGYDGYTTALNNMPDIIVSDVIMPEMNGIEMCKNLKSNLLTSHIPIILLTQKSEIEDKISGLESGADDYIEKPFNLQYLLLRIKNIIEFQNKLKDRIIQVIGKEDIEVKEISVFDRKILEKCKNAVINNLSDVEFSVVELGSIVGMSRSQLYRKITALTGKTPAEFIYSYRLEKAKYYLKDENNTVMEVAHLTGFKSSNSFSTVFKKHFGISPSEYIIRQKELI